MRFVLRRLLLFVVALLAISVAVFAMLRILPGDVAAVMAGVNSPPERVAQLRAELGLDRPLPVQYLDWCGALVRGDFGTSMLTGRSITTQVGARAAVTFPLIILGLVIGIDALGVRNQHVSTVNPQRPGRCTIAMIVDAIVLTVKLGIFWRHDINHVALDVRAGFPAVGMTGHYTQRLSHLLHPLGPQVVIDLISRRS